VAAGKVGDGGRDGRPTGAISAVSDAITKVDVLAQIRRVRRATAELGVLANHVVHARLLSAKRLAKGPLPQKGAGELDLHRRQGDLKWPWA
jgi:hypothetical protein